MVGRTPEYLGKKIEAFDMKMVCLVILAPPLLMLIGPMLTVMNPQTPEWLTNSADISRISRYAGQVHGCQPRRLLQVLVLDLGQDTRAVNGLILEMQSFHNPKDLPVGRLLKVVRGHATN